MSRTPTCRRPDCANHLDRRCTENRTPCAYGFSDIPKPGEVRRVVTFFRHPDGTAEVTVGHRHAGTWVWRTVDDVTAKELIEQHRPPIFATDSRPPR